MNDYKDIWTKGEGFKFWNTVDFNHPDYKLQESVFRQILTNYNKIFAEGGLYEGIKPESVLELGIGTGRMSKIMLEIFPNIQIYNAVDINFYPIKINNIGVYNADVADETFFENINAFYSGRRWDFVLASEVFMHIKPEDIERVIKSVKNLLAPNGTILNIDWSVQAPQEHSNWCYIHDYDKLYRENGLKPIFTADIHKQKLFCYGA
jgi:SAM-dependent methyltransferase